MADGGVVLRKVSKIRNVGENLAHRRLQSSLAFDPDQRLPPLLLTGHSLNDFLERGTPAAW